MIRSFNYRRFSVFAFTSVLLAVAAQSAVAQNEPSLARYKFASPEAFHQPVSPLPVEFGFVHSHSSTAAEGFLRGKAAVIQAIGNRNLLDSQAAILFEHARALDRDNDLLQTQALHVQQALWRQARDENRAYREKRLAEGRAKLALRRATVHRAAYQLSPSQLNTLTGAIQWPAALASAKYRLPRERVQELVRQHVSYGEPGLGAEISRAADELVRALRKDIDVVPRDEYLAAQKFLRGLKLAVSDVQG